MHDYFVLAVEGFARNAWSEYSGLPVDTASRADIGALRAFIAHWTNEGYRRLAELGQPNQSLTRRGYRSEVRKWMERNEIATIEEATRELGISETTLKSVMSEKGEPRYSPETLKRILGQIGE